MHLYEEITKAVKLLAWKDRRSFNGEVNARLEFAIVQRSIIEDGMRVNTEINPETRESFTKLTPHQPSATQE